jgi:hypothetical protein
MTYLLRHTAHRPVVGTLVPDPEICSQELLRGKLKTKSSMSKFYSLFIEKQMLNYQQCTISIGSQPLTNCSLNPARCVGPITVFQETES